MVARPHTYFYTVLIASKRAKHSIKVGVGARLFKPSTSMQGFACDFFLGDSRLQIDALLRSQARYCRDAGR